MCPGLILTADEAAAAMRWAEEVDDCGSCVSVSPAMLDRLCDLGILKRSANRGWIDGTPLLDDFDSLMSPGTRLGFDV